MNFEYTFRVLFRRTLGSQSAPILVPELKSRHYELLDLLYEAIKDAFGVFVYSLPSSFIYIHLKSEKQCRCINALDLSVWATNPVRIVSNRSIFFKPIDFGN
jgi:hypothetical protein